MVSKLRSAHWPVKSVTGRLPFVSIFNLLTELVGIVKINHGRRIPQGVVKLGLQVHRLHVELTFVSAVPLVVKLFLNHKRTQRITAEARIENSIPFRKTYALKLRLELNSNERRQR